MQLTPEKHDVVKVNTAGRRSFVVALFGLSGAAVSALLAIPLVRFVTYPLRKNAAGTTWSDVGPVEDFASLTAPVAKTITLERRDAWQSTSSQTAVYVLPSKAGQFPKNYQTGTRPAGVTPTGTSSSAWRCFCEGSARN